MIGNELVRLRSDHAGLPEGARGRIVGFYRRAGGDVAVVSFTGTVAPVPVELLAPNGPDGVDPAGTPPAR